MRIVIIGAGNVATVLGKMILRAGHTILQVVSRDFEHAKALSAILDCASSDIDGLIDASADIYILAISDSSLYDISKKIRLNKGIILHTAGSVSKGILKDISSDYGVLYPLQSLRKEMITIPDVPLLIDGSSPEVTGIIEDFANSISAKVQRSGDDQRLYLHVAAVVVSNFPNHLYALAKDFCDTEKVDFKMLLPLIRETATRLESYSAKEMQTGPALRNDFVTLDKHNKILMKFPRLRNLYLKITDSIMSDDREN